tara:strand:- start:550 stop:1110 length:561 start_codon:yes stop_codon:yes gene_type:complete
MISEPQRELIEKKYGKLIHKIGHNISGDLAISSHPDNVQDLWVSVLEAVQGFAKKEKQTFDEFWGTKGFDKYIKTCLWNSKNSKGAKITKKYPITKCTVDIVDNAEVLSLEAPPHLSTESPIFMEEAAPLLTDEQQEVVLRLVEEPKYLKPSGKVNIQALAQDLKKSWYEVKNIVNSISYLLENEL